MFQLFSRAKTGNQFRARNAARDAETDAARVGAIVSAIEAALLAAQAEHAGLSERLHDVLARAAITVGTETDEYIDRAPEDTALQNQFSTEIANGERRLRELETSMGHYQFLKTVLATRFPEHTAADGGK
ncbi:hypothetical protein KQX64_23355 [Rhodopseudomonas palustris]|nr:hypothetical protein KQX64_23355 [Rhodopseudomonas palustris]